MLTDDQKREAIVQMMVTCELKKPNYEMVSARSVLYELGYSTDETQEVLQYIADRGFDYCLDSTIKCSKGFDLDEKSYPTQEVCVWGPDQLKSRLQSIR